MKIKLKELRTFIKLILMERNFDTKSFVQSKILSKADELFGVGSLKPGHGKSGEIRLQPKDRDTKFSNDQIKELLLATGYHIKRIVTPGEPGSMSTKFDTYLNDSGYALTIAGGGTRGQEFERKIQTSTIDSGELKSLIVSLQEKIGSKLKIKSHSPGPSYVKRPLGISPTDVGKIIADLILNTDQGDIYISLKDPSGSTFGNFGIAGSFEVNKSGEIVEKEHPSDDLIKKLGIEKSLIAKGLNAYLKNEKPDETVTTSDNVYVDNTISNTVSKIIQSGYGYGYWYARKTSDGWQIVDLTTKEKLEEYVGKVTSIKIKYPDAESKQCSEWITTSSGNVYKFEIRNTKAGIVPTEIKVKIQKPKVKIQKSF
jgi:hypothetical protein